jgi:hypothetical protein
MNRPAGFMAEERTEYEEEEEVNPVLIFRQVLET